MYIVLPSVTLLIIISSLLITETISDLRTRELDLPIIAFAFGFGLLYLSLFQTISGSDALLGGFVGFIPFFLLALFGNAGGGDSLIMGIVGMLSGIGMISYIVLFSAVSYLLQAVITKIKCRDDKSYTISKAKFPFVPHILFGWITTIFCALLSTPQIFVL